MNIKELINEMGKELLPSLSSKEDMTLLKQLKYLHKKNLVEFEKKLERINLIRKTEGLEPIHKNEILGTSVKSDIKSAMRKKVDSLISGKGIAFKYNIFETPSLEERKKLGKNYKHIMYFFIDGKKYEIIFRTKLEYPHVLDDLIGLEISPKDIEHRIIGHEIRFPTLNKKIILTASNQGDTQNAYKLIKLRVKKI